MLLKPAEAMKAFSPLSLHTHTGLVNYSVVTKGERKCQCNSYTFAIL